VGDTLGSTSNTELISTLKTGFLQIDPIITIPESTFCITGVSKKFKRREIAEKIELYGRYIVENVRAKLNYLIVCNEKNNCWAFTCYKT
jgi:NAD-dependent DNA ligase